MAASGMGAPEGYDPRVFDPVAVTVDIVALTIRDGDLHVLVVKRGEAPYKGWLALPGGFVRGDTLDQAAARELAEETGLRPAQLRQLRVHMEQLQSYGEPDRDPRMRVISVAGRDVARRRAFWHHARRVSITRTPCRLDFRRPAASSRWCRARCGP